MLPVNEEYFQINANERRIKIPDNFKLHGIGVQGDQIAETLYFRVNRYFDHMDLNNTNIYIQWTYLDEKGIVVNSGTCADWVRDITSDPNYLIFGWVIKDDITENAGTIRFSIRFVQWDDKKENIIYSLGTLEHQLVVNKALRVDLNLAAIEQNIMETERLMSASIKPAYRSDLKKVDSPEYTLTLIDYILNQQNFVKKEENGTVYYQVDLLQSKDDSIQEYPFQIQAKSIDGGNIAYEWYDLSKITNGAPTRLTGIQTNDVYVKVLTQEQIDNKEEIYGDTTKLYYIPNEEGNGYVIDTAMNSGTSDLVKPNHYFRYGQYMANKPGKYLGVAVNSHSDGSAKLPNPSDLIEIHNDGSYTIKYHNAYGPVEVPGPEHTKITIPYEKAYLQLNSDFSIEPQIDNLTVNPANMKYQWYRLDSEGNETKLVDQTSATLVLPKSNEYIKDLQGEYYLSVKASKNNGEVIDDTKDNLVVVTYEPSTISEIKLVDQDTNVPLSAGSPVYAGDTIIATPTLKDDYQLEDYAEYYVEWRKMGTNDVLKKGYSKNEDLEAMTYTIPETLLGATIQCVIVNYYNGKPSQKKASTGLFIDNQKS